MPPTAIQFSRFPLGALFRRSHTVNNPVLELNHATNATYNENGLFEDMIEKAAYVMRQWSNLMRLMQSHSILARYSMQASQAARHAVVPASHQPITPRPDTASARSSPAVLSASRLLAPPGRDRVHYLKYDP